MIEQTLGLIDFCRFRVIGWRQLTDGTWRASLTDYQDIWVTSEATTAGAALEAALAMALRPRPQVTQAAAVTAEEMDL